MKKVIVLSLGLVLVSSLVSFWQKRPSSPNQSNHLEKPPVPTIVIRDKTYQIEIADSDNERVKGLSGRDQLASESGMLFVYETKDRYSFWMKGMRIPLDFVWIADSKIVDLSENVQVPLTDTYTPIIQPKVAVDKILEINAGEIKKNGFQIGDTVQLVLVQGE